MCYQRYLIVLIQSCFLFKPLGHGGEGWVAVHQVRYVQNITLLVQPAIAICSDAPDCRNVDVWLGIIFVVRLVTTLLSERQTKEQLATAHEQLRLPCRLKIWQQCKSATILPVKFTILGAHAHRSKYSVANGNEALAMRSWQVRPF